ncbi:hypothetical protein NRB20_61330 [Nocardia sp. RB20]|uniref:DUF5753 domain-containing protein n=1 Tax=Nocardia macrotermitis TaxID=2585198 RepID=A0A7K0DBF2_9NOCA|nr:DUF5753 domain-containing protein [Nocardia macrotermitis]MQY23008.1 hypothetical protein [Nocardia macrotermitis]
MPVSEAARVAEVSPEVIRRMESGRITLLGTIHITVLLDRFEVDDDREPILTLVRMVRQYKKIRRHWWDPYSDLLPEQEIDLLGLEESARVVSVCGATAVPELLRTPDYHRAVLRVWDPQESDIDLDRRVELLTQRRDRLRDNGIRLRGYILEAALRNPMGGPEMMAAQLTGLVGRGADKNVSVQVIGSGTGTHLGWHLGDVSMLEFDALVEGVPEPPIVHSQNMLWDIEQDGDDVDGYLGVFAELRRTALAQKVSRSLIEEIAHGYSDEATTRSN